MNGAYPLFACMGPLQKGEFEKRLDPNWWKFLFSSTYNDTPLYLKTDGDVVEDPDITQAEVDVFIKVRFSFVSDDCHALLILLYLIFVYRPVILDQSTTY